MNADVQITREIKNMGIVEIENNKRILYRIVKRIVDIIGALVGCIILAPLTIGIWLANIIAKDNGSVFYVQKRIGKNGQPFKLYKYRSMVVDADKKLKKYLIDNPEANEEYLKYRKLKEDPRITAVGRFIRKTSLDEFPQFINVLKGEMSLVGPRPYLFREKKAIKSAYNEIIKIKPGITGPWQVGGRNDVSLEERMKLDVEYIKNENMKSDIKYLLKTIVNFLKLTKCNNKKHSLRSKI